MMTEPSPRTKRLRRWCILALLAYPAYLLLLGPYYALDGRGWLDFVPEPLRNLYYWPAAPIYKALGPENFYDAYLDCWYHDPNAGETMP